VKLCDREYTTLKWFKGKDVGEQERGKVHGRCAANAVELRRGDPKTLINYGWAKAQRPKELLPGRTNLSADWLDTTVKAARSVGPMQVRKGSSGRNVLYRVEDIVAYYSAQRNRF
jgi:hypothetical protein